LKRNEPRLKSAKVRFDHVIAQHVIVLCVFAGVITLLASGPSRAAEPEPRAAESDEKASAGAAGDDNVMTQKPGDKTKGYTCVFMGHSFFYRVAHDFDRVAIGSGFTEHKQVVRVARGLQGTPGWLWKNVGPKEEARRMLKEEKVDVLAISYHFASPEECRVEDYANWIDFARQKNPNIKIAIGISWLRAGDRTPEQYLEAYTWVAKKIYPLIDDLREKYPDNEIIALPHGRGVIELYAQFKAGKLPEIQSLLPPGKNTLFTDATNHAGPMALAVTRLIFLATIYETDPRKSEWATGFKADLKQIAYDAVKGERYARHLRGKQ
jgi:hypothetical protein